MCKNGAKPPFSGVTYDLTATHPFPQKLFLPAAAGYTAVGGGPSKERQYFDCANAHTIVVLYISRIGLYPLCILALLYDVLEKTRL